jgi:CRP/FNR family transcriptional regulator, cyclic AMP receptor protein
MALPEALGFLASALVLLTFGMRTMLPMRLLAILSNLAFITYGLSLDLTPVWALHGILLPLNLYRLRELLERARRKESATPGEPAPERLRRSIAPRRFAAGAILFRKGEPACELFYILKGRIRLRDLDGNVSAADPLTELSPSAPGGRRSATAVCETDCELLVVSAILPEPRPQPVRKAPAARRPRDRATRLPRIAWAHMSSG